MILSKSSRKIFGAKTVSEPAVFIPASTPAASRVAGALWRGGAWLGPHEQ